MRIRNYEFKAKTTDLYGLEHKLLELNPLFIGEDHQIDTYFNVPSGRLKLREGVIENALIYYERPDTSNAKQSHIILYKHNPDNSLKEILTTVIDIKVIVDKRRKIYFLGNVKFHFDDVKGLGSFIEVEALDETGQADMEMLIEQCQYYFSYFGLNISDYVAKSYSDLILEKSIDNNGRKIL